LVKQQEDALAREMHARMEEDRLRAEEQVYEEMQRKLLENMQRRQMLAGQMEERQKQRQAAYEQFLREKSLVDEVVRNLAEEDRVKRENAMKRRNELQDSIQQFLEERRLWRDAERKRAEEELHKIQEYNRLQQQRQADLMRKRQHTMDKRDEALSKITADIEAKKREEEEMQALLFELYQEEAESRALAAVKAEEDKATKARTDMHAANEYQKQLKQQKRVETQKEEAELRDRMLKKFEDDARLEQMNAARRRREMQIYREQVDKMIEDRREFYERAKAMEVAELSAVKGKEDYRLQVVERERQRLLQVHAQALRDFLPKGVLMNAADYERVMGRKLEQKETTNASATGRRRTFGKKYNVFSM